MLTMEVATRYSRSHESFEKETAQMRIRYLEDIQKLDGVISAWIGDGNIIFVTLRNHRVTCVHGFDSSALAKCLGELYASEEKQSLMNAMADSDEPVVNPAPAIAPRLTRSSSIRNRLRKLFSLSSSEHSGGENSTVSHNLNGKEEKKTSNLNSLHRQSSIASITKAGDDATLTFANTESRLTTGIDKVQNTPSDTADRLINVDTEARLASIEPSAIGCCSLGKSPELSQLASVYHEVMGASGDAKCIDFLDYFSDSNTQRGEFIFPNVTSCEDKTSKRAALPRPYTQENSDKLKTAGSELPKVTDDGDSHATRNSPVLNETDIKMVPRNRPAMLQNFKRHSFDSSEMLSFPNQEEAKVPTRRIKLHGSRDPGNMYISGAETLGGLPEDTRREGLSSVVLGQDRLRHLYNQREIDRRRLTERRSHSLSDKDTPSCFLERAPDSRSLATPCPRVSNFHRSHKVQQEERTETLKSPDNIALDDDVDDHDGEQLPAKTSPILGVTFIVGSSSSQSRRNSPPMPISYVDTQPSSPLGRHDRENIRSKRGVPRRKSLKHERASLWDASNGSRGGMSGEDDSMHSSSSLSSSCT